MAHALHFVVQAHAARRATNMSRQAEVIALFLPEGDSSRSNRATMLVRNADGQVSLETVNPDSTLGQHAMSTGCFRNSTPIYDPVTREVLGYEMEWVPAPLALVR